MFLILAIEPDRRQANKLSALARGPLREVEMLTVASVDEGIEILRKRVPDLVLTSLLLSAKDDAVLAERLRKLDAAGHQVQTLVIPMFAGPAKGGLSQGLLSRLTKSQADHGSPQGCQPAVFGAQVLEYLERLELEREAREESSQPYSAAPEILYRQPTVDAPYQQVVASVPAEHVVVPEPVRSEEPVTFVDPVVPVAAAPAVMEAPPAPPVAEAPVAAPPKPAAPRVVATPKAAPPPVRTPRTATPPVVTPPRTAAPPAVTTPKAAAPPVVTPPKPAAPPVAPPPIAAASPVGEPEPIVRPAPPATPAARKAAQTAAAPPNPALDEDPEVAKFMAALRVLPVVELVDAAPEPERAENKRPAPNTPPAVEPARLDPPQQTPPAPAAARKPVKTLKPARARTLPPTAAPPAAPGGRKRLTAIRRIAPTAPAPPDEPPDPPPNDEPPAAPTRPTVKVVGRIHPGSSSSAPSAHASTRKPGSRRPRPIQDEWGFFDPDQCGFPAVQAKLEEIEEPDLFRNVRTPPKTRK